MKIIFTFLAMMTLSIAGLSQTICDIHSTKPVDTTLFKREITPDNLCGFLNKNNHEIRIISLPQKHTIILIDSLKYANCDTVAV